MDILLTYDIDTHSDEGERRLARVAKVCEGYGTRVQDSVFECRLSPAAMVRLTAELTDLIDARLDSVHLYRFDGPLVQARTSIGRPPEREPGRPWLL